MLPDDMQAPEQLPSHEAPQLASQLKLPASTEQPPMQLPSHEAWQLGSVAVQPPVQLASS
jgi:hypothetical protein